MPSRNVRTQFPHTSTSFKDQSVQTIISLPDDRFSGFTHIFFQDLRVGDILICACDELHRGYTFVVNGMYFWAWEIILAENNEVCSKLCKVVFRTGNQQPPLENIRFRILQQQLPSLMQTWPWRDPENGFESSVVCVFSTSVDSNHEFNISNTIYVAPNRLRSGTIIMI